MTGGFGVNEWRDILAIIQSLVLATVTVVGVWLKSIFASRKDLRDLEKRVAVVEARAPDPAQVTDMQTSIARLAASVEGLVRELEVVAGRLDRIETHLLKQASR